MTSGQGCDGDSVAMTSATNPSLEDIILGVIPGMPRVVIHTPVLAYENGAEFLQAWYDAEAGKLDPFVLILEGSVPNEKINGDGHWAGIGVNPENGQPITTNEWIDRLAPKAAAVVAIGTCATYGGIPAMKNNPTGAMGLPDYLGWNFRSTAGLPIVCIPGCPAQPDNMTETLLYLVLHLGGLAPAPDLDEQLRPKLALRAHRARGLQPRAASPSRATSRPSTATTRAASSSSAARARWSSATCPIRGWQNGMGGCPNVGGICMACTMPGLPGQVHAVHGRGHATAASRRGRRSSPTAPILRYFRHRNIKKKYDNEPAWRHPSRS